MHLKNHQHQLVHSMVCFAISSHIYQHWSDFWTLVYYFVAVYFHSYLIHT